MKMIPSSGSSLYFTLTGWSSASPLCSSSQTIWMFSVPILPPWNTWFSGHTVNPGEPESWSPYCSSAEQNNKTGQSAEEIGWYWSCSGVENHPRTNTPDRRRLIPPHLILGGPPSRQAARCDSRHKMETDSLMVSGCTGSYWRPLTGLPTGERAACRCYRCSTKAEHRKVKDYHSKSKGAIFKYRRSHLKDQTISNQRFLKAVLVNPQRGICFMSWKHPKQFQHSQIYWIKENWNLSVASVILEHLKKNKATLGKIQMFASVSLSFNWLH